MDELLLKLLNRQISSEMRTGYQYMIFGSSLKYMGLPNMSKFFDKESKGEFETCNIISEFITNRGGSPIFDKLDKPKYQTKEADSASGILKYAIIVETEDGENWKDIAVKSKDIDFEVHDFAVKYMAKVTESLSVFNKMMRIIKIHGNGNSNYLMALEKMCEQM